MTRVRLGLSSAVAILLSIGAAACGEPQCPAGYTKKGDTCYRNKDGGTGSISEVEGGDGPVGESGDASSRDHTSLDASVDAPDEPDARESDSGVPSVDAAHADAAAVDEALDAALVIDAGSASDSAVATVVTCASKPCENGGSCADEPDGFHCSCPEPFIGDRCTARICPTIFLRTQDDLVKAQQCGEIQGDLNVASAGIPSITASDLPHLTKITGNLTVTSMFNNGVETPRLQNLTLAALREVEGAMAVLFTGAGSVEEVGFPALTRVGTAQVNFTLTETKVLDLSALTTVNGHFYINQLYYLCSLYLKKIETVTGAVETRKLHNLSPSAIQPLFEAATGPVIDEIGCCSIGDKLACDGFNGDSLLRCGCSLP